MTNKSEVVFDTVESAIEESRETVANGREGIIREVSDLVDSFFTQVSQRHDSYEKEFVSLKDHVAKNTRRIKKIESSRIDEVLNDISRRMVTELVRELLTPI